MTTIDHSGPDADDLAARSRANDTLSSIMEAAPAGTPDAERLTLATTAYGRRLAQDLNNRARDQLFAGFRDPQQPVAE